MGYGIGCGVGLGLFPILKIKLQNWLNCFLCNGLPKDVDTCLLFLFSKITVFKIIVEHFCVFVRVWGTGYEERHKPLKRHLMFKEDF